METTRVPDAIAAAVVTPAAYAEDRPVHDAFRWLRANAPLAKVELDGLYPMWIVSKHADILEISRQNDLFHSGDRATTFTTIQGDEIVKGLTGGSAHLLRAESRPGIRGGYMRKGPLNTIVVPPPASCWLTRGHVSLGRLSKGI